MKLVIINGLPGTGKTTLANLLSKELIMPIVAKDTIKEFLFDELGVTDRTWSRTLGMASNDFLYQLTDIMLASDKSLIIENAFEVAFARPRLKVLVNKYKPSVLEVYCTTDPAIRKQRFVSRNETGERHQGHFDQENYAAKLGPEPYEKYSPIEIGPVLRIDTTEDTDLKKIIKAVHELA